MSEYLSAKFTRTELDLIRRAAKVGNLTRWIRETLLEAARKVRFEEVERAALITDAALAGKRISPD